MRIAVAGIGYVGLSNAIILAQHNQVTICDIVQSKVDLINKHQSPLVDKDISFYLENKNLNLKATTSVIDAYKDAEIVIIATPTNYDPDTNKFDTSSVETVIENVLQINPNAWIVIKSTVGVGFTNYITNKYGVKKIVFSPEFLREGKALYDNLFPSRIIVGVLEKDSFYLTFANTFINLLKAGALKENIKSLVLGAEEAESVKLFSNTYLALRVAYFNELDTFASSKNLCTKDIIEGVSSDPRIGDFYNNPSFGYGGYCLPKDTKELRANYKNVPQNLISAIVESNLTREQFIANEIYDIAKKNNFNKPIGIYRLIMKAGSDNFRSSSIQAVISLLLEKGMEIVIFEPTLTSKKFLECDVTNDFDNFVNSTSLIVTNRFDDRLSGFEDRVYTKDLYRRD